MNHHRFPTGSVTIPSIDERCFPDEPSQQHPAPDGDLREAGSSAPSGSVTSSFILFHANIRGFYSNIDELETVFQLSDRKPALIALNETFLDDSTHSASLAGYRCVGRRDRSTGFAGGIILFALEDHWA